MSDQGKGEFWAFLAGVLAGGIVALLYAPARGEETRERIRETAGELKVKGSEFASHAKDEAGKVIAGSRQFIDETGHKFDEAVHKGREKLDTAKEKGLEKLETVKQKGMEKLEQVKGKSVPVEEEPAEGTV